MTKWWNLRSGETVRDRKTSHLKDDVLDLLAQALPSIRSEGRDFLIEEVDFVRIIGLTTCLKTGPSDKIVYAQRPNRDGLTRFVKNRKATPCSTLTVILMRPKAENPGEPRPDYYVIITAFVGKKAEPEPWDPRATPRSATFWSTHALQWGAESVLPETETTVCPW